MLELRLLGTVQLHGVPPGSAASSLGTGAIVTQPKQVALLAYLALAGAGAFRRRDTLLALFWPELDDAHARAALRQALHRLRRALGPRVLVSRAVDELGISQEELWLDVAAFDRAIGEKRPAEALELYRGDLLAGFHISDMAPEFEQWLDGERARLREDAARAAWTLADGRRLARDPAGALAYGRRALAIAAGDEGALRRLLLLCDQLGERAAALRAYDEFAARLARDYDAEPSPETKALARSIRQRSAPHHISSANDADDMSGTANSEASIHAGSGPVLPAGRATEPRARRDRSRVRPAALALALAFVATLAAGSLAVARRVSTLSPRTGLLAMGAFRDLTGDSTSLARAVGTLLATNLARQPGLRVVSPAHIHEVLGRESPRRPPDDATPEEITRAAAHAGADEYLEGTIRRGGAGRLRLDLRRVDARTGALRAEYTVDGGDLLGLVDSATARVAADFTSRREHLRVADVTTSSVVAFRFYEEGLRNYYRGDYRTALPLFEAAVGEDSTFALAAFYVWQTQVDLGIPNAEPALRQALRFADRAPDRERLLIKGLGAATRGEPSALAFAESLVVRYADEPEGHYLYGAALLSEGNFLGAVRELQRVVTIDSTGLLAGRSRCRACDALRQIVSAYTLADSLEAAERTARAWLAQQPGSAMAAASLATALELQGRTHDALAARRSTATPETGGSYDAIYPAMLRIRDGRFEEADRMLDESLRSGPLAVRPDALWFRVLSLRQQGRISDALELIRSRGGAVPMTVVRRAASFHDSALRIADIVPQMAQLLFEAGRFRESARVFESLANAATPDYASPGRFARQKSWNLTHRATALFAAGDTALLSALADTIRDAGRKSAYGRDRRIHHHVRGLLLAGRGDIDSAEFEFRRAIFSTTSGYTRTNLELARVLLRLRRPREAVVVLQPALRGSLEASNLYVTRTELHELLAQAHDAAGARDSAIAHYRQVHDAWRRGDPPFRVRAAGARARAEHLSGLRGSAR